MDLPKIRVLQTRKTEEKDRRIAGLINRRSSHGAEPTGPASIEPTVLPVIRSSLDRFEAA